MTTYYLNSKAVGSEGKSLIKGKLVFTQVQSQTKCCIDVSIYNFPFVKKQEVYFLLPLLWSQCVYIDSLHEHGEAGRTASILLI